MLSLLAVALLLVLVGLWAWTAGYQRGWGEGRKASEGNFAQLQAKSVERDRWWLRGEPPPWEAE
jgi:hypothetical protein